MGISTHILDTTQGRPAAGVSVLLERQLENQTWSELARKVTDSDGRVKPLLETIPAEGVYRITFGVADYIKQPRVEGFYPRVSIEFSVRAANQHYHVPLLLNPFGFSTYRGS
jgi:5-hydroxyisourate hydrolase